MRHFMEAVSLFRRNPRLRRYAIQPLGWTAALFVAIAVVGYWLLVPALSEILSRVGLESAAVPLYLILWLLATGVFFLVIAGFIGSLVWDRLSEEVELILTGTSPRTHLPRTLVAIDAFKRLLWSLSLGILAIVSGIFLPVVGPLVVLAYLGMLDFTASPLLRRGILLRQQRKTILKMKGSVDLGLIFGTILIIPVVNVLALPLLVTAGTVMVVRSGQ
jgi:uncharacterized protein involved in cysteine biosynthesis